jgi:uncharacterized membrane protein YphA (DoxX/SURF4 family)
MAQSSRSATGRVLLLLGRLALAAIFLLAAYGKLRPQNAVPWTLSSLRISPSSLTLSMLFFEMEVSSYQMLPDWGASAVAHALPWVELALGILLLIGLGLRHSAVVATLLLAVLLAVVTRAYALHMSINCGCFSPNEPLTGWTVARDASFFACGIAVTIGAFVLDRRNRIDASAFAQAESSAR